MAVEITLDQVKEFAKNSDRKKNILETNPGDKTKVVKPKTQGDALIESLRLNPMTFGAAFAIDKANKERKEKGLEPITEDDLKKELQTKQYEYGFYTDIEADTLPVGLNEDIIIAISKKKEEPEWLTDWRLKAYSIWKKMEEPHWANIDYNPIDYQVQFNTQCFPLYYYEERDKQNPSIFDTAGEGEYIKRDGVSDFILKRARENYDDRVTKEDIFYYVYGILHSPDYRTTFANDLKKTLPRIPLVDSSDDFWAFSKAGRDLAELHLNLKPNLLCDVVN